jgi:hypothetical protein
MDGVFINLTNKNVELNVVDKNIMIPGNPDLITPIREIIMTDNNVNGILSTPLKEDDIRYLHGTNWINTLYNKITRSEEDIKITVSLINPYVKYPFTKEQIDKINGVSNRRTRLLIVTKDDAQYWSDGKFECPFRNYRLFVHINNNTLIEYPIPKTYLDTAVESMKNLGSKLTRS